MVNAYTQLLVQFVFAVKNRMGLVNSDMREAIEKYIGGIVQNNGHKLLAIYCMPDHCHILVGLNPKQSISDLVRDVKSNSSKWINDQRLSKYNFQWQDGYGAFSYSKSQLEGVVQYILKQAEHHKRKTFSEEYSEFMEKFEIEHDERYLFKPLE